jgi:hypothetical protein
MGTWDAGSFGNDTAVDWSYGLERAADLRYVEAAFDRVVAEGGNPVTAEAAEQAVAAAEVIARLQGRFGTTSPYTQATDTWVRAHAQSVPSALAAKAKAALERIIRPPSELRDLWVEAGDVENWVGEIDELRRRVTS